MVSGSLALLYFLLGFHGGRQGSGPDRGRSPVEWEDFLSVCPFVRPSVHSPLWAIQPGLRPSQPSLKPETWLVGRLGLRPGWLGLRPGWMAQRGDGWTSERTDKQMDGKSPHSTGLHPLSRPLPKNHQSLGGKIQIARIASKPPF